MLIYRENELQKAVNFFWDFLQNFSEARIIGLSGNLGAGKTTFVKKLLANLGVEENVISPTFILRRDYEVKDGKIKRVIHIDAYRLDSPTQIYQIISPDELTDRDNLILVEWPELAENIFHQIFLFEHIDETTRKITIQ